MNTPKPRTRWTQRELAYLAANWRRDGAKLIARVLGRSPAAVNQMAQRLELRHQRYTQNLLARVKERCVLEGPARSPCWVWQRSIGVNGKPAMNVKSRQWSGSVRRAVMQASGHAKALEDTRMKVTDTCGNPLCCNPAHLRLATCGELASVPRSVEARAKQIVRSRNSPSNKLTMSHVQQIRARVLRGEKQQALAAEFGVHHSLISAIKRGKAWRTASPWDGMGARA